MARYQYAPLRDFTDADARSNYRGLDKSSRIVDGAWEIRLISLKPSKNIWDPIQCSLCHATFSDVKVEYEALSYVWADRTGILNDDQTPCEITVNNFPFPVTPNLRSALIRLRGCTGDRVLWVDQICINQNDLSERNSQVDRMALIYGFAKQTIVWLGEEADASFRGMLLLTGLARVSRLPSPEERAAAAINEFSNRDRWRALGDFMKRQWWQRTWVVQECVITRKVIIKCGYRELPWASLMSAVYFINLLRDTLPLCVGLVNTSAVSELELGRLRVASRGTEPPEDGRQLDTLLEALTRYRRRLATDPRDKIYAIMRLARDFRDMSCSTGQSPIEVNYSKSAEDVYFDTAKFFLRTEKPLEFLCHCRLTKILSSLSSWVPDWSDTNDFPRPFRSIRPPYADSAAYFQLFGSSLGVKGIRMGNVNVLGEVCTEVECLRTEASALFVRWRGIALDSLSTIIASEGNIDEQFIRVLVAEQHLGRTLDQQTMDDLVEAYQIWYGIAPTYKDRRHISEAMKVVDFIRSVRRACQGRRLFVSSKGSIGLAPRETTVGDSIAFILGQEFPLVLRQVILGQYLLVGSCYIPGVIGDDNSLSEAENFMLI